MRAMTKTFQLKVSPKEYDKWVAAAKEHQCTLAEWIRQRCRGPGRLRPARKPVVEPVAEPKAEVGYCIHGVDYDLECDACEQRHREREADRVRWEANLEAQEAERERPEDAARQMKAAGGLKKWWPTLSSREQREFEDLREFLIQREESDRLTREWLAQQENPPAVTPTPPPAIQPAVMPWQPPGLPPGQQQQPAPAPDPLRAAAARSFRARSGTQAE